ncbi:MAG: right-handed parallel beta-helix repeat-containing protein [Ardenticatenales bacterium]
MKRLSVAAPAAAWTAARALAAIAIPVVAASAVPGGAPVMARRTADVCGPVSGDATWSAAGGPYLTTCDVTVPAGASLTIEAGAVVRLGPSHRVDVSGRLAVQGTAAAPVHFEAAGAQPWGSIQLRAGSGPSVVRFADIGGGGALRKEMLGIETDAASVTDSTLHDTAGVGLEIRAGASPSIVGNLFTKASTTNAQPSAALRVFGASHAEIRGNRFENNQQYPIYLDAAADARLAGNRLEYNAYNAVLLAGTFSGTTSLANLGPRRYAYHVRSVMTVKEGATLAIAPGATFQFFSGSGLTIDGTLRAIGQPGREIVFTAEGNGGAPGTWGQLRFSDKSVDYDAATDVGSRLEHAVIEWGGFDASGALYIQRSSPRVAYVSVHGSNNRGVTVEGDGARPALIGLDIRDNVAEMNGIGLQIRGGARPTLRFSTVSDNWLGVDVRLGAIPDLSGGNRFAGNAAFGVRVDETDTICVGARDDDWGAPDGPLDGSDRPDACNNAEHAGNGQLVSDGVDYAGWVGQLAPPTITSPRCGDVSSLRPTISGDGPPDSTVIVYDHAVEIGRTMASAAGEEGLGTWTLTPPKDLAAGGHALQARAENAAGKSGPGAVLGLVIDPDAILAGDQIYMRQTLEGTRYSQPYAGSGGCAVVSDDSAWQVAMHPGAPLELQLGARCPSGATVTATYRDADVPLTPSGDGLWAGTLDMADGGQLHVAATCDNRRQAVDLGTVQVALAGFVHDALGGGDQRVSGAKVTLYRFDAAINNFRIWKAAEYGDQTNPQTTGFLGWYGFYPPPGRYRAVVDAAGYDRYIASDLALSGQPYHVTIPIQPKATPVRPTPDPSKLNAIYLPMTQRQAERP